MSWVVTINGVNRTSYVRPFDAVQIVNRIHEGSGTATIPIRDDTGALTIVNEQSLKVEQNGTRLFEGLIRRISRGDKGWSTGPRVYVLEAQDYSTLLDDDVIETAFRSTTESDKARITWLVNTFGTRGVTAGTEVQTLLATMPPGEDGRPEQDFSGKTLREAIEQIAKLGGGRYYVDYDKKLHYFATETILAPYMLSDAYNGSTSVGYWDLNLDDDSVDLVHEVLVVGTGVKVWRSIASPPALGSRRRAVIRDDNITSVSQANDAGDAYLDQYGTARNSGSVMTRTPGFRAGQTVKISHTGHGLVEASYIIAAVTAKTASPDAVNFALELNDAAFDLGDVIQGQSRIIDGLGQQATEQGAALKELQSGGANLLANSSFESAISTAQWTLGTGWVAVVPGTGQAAYHLTKTARIIRAAATGGALDSRLVPVDRLDDYWISLWSFLRSRSAGSAVISVLEYNAASTLLTTTVIATLSAAETKWTRHTVRFGPNEQLGRRAFNLSTAFIRLRADISGTATLTWDVDGAQIESGTLLTAYAPTPQELVDSSITGTQMADLSVTLAKLAADSVDNSKLVNDAVNAAKIATNAITTTKIADNAITTPKVVALAIDAGKIAAGAVIAGKIAANTVTATEIAALTITAAEIAAGAITTLKIVSGAIDSDKIAANAIVAGKIAAGIITAAEIASNAITTAKIAANAITAVEIALGAVAADEIAAGAVGSTKIADNAIIGTKINAGAITTPKIATNAVTATEIAALTITAAEIAANAVTTAKIAASAVTAVEIAAGAITTAKLNATASIQLVSNAGAEVVINASGLTVTGGSMTVTNPGGTVIIDGTSNMFKIAASGTLSRLNVANTVDSTSTTNVVVSGSSATLAVVAMIGNDSIASDRRSIGDFIVEDIRYVASVSGGATTSRMICLISFAEISNNYTGSATQQVKLLVSNAGATGINRYARYYLLKESAI